VDFFLKETLINSIPPVLNFCTLFDKNYLHYGLSLWSSLNRIIPNRFQLFVLCLDDITYQFFIENKFDGIVPVQLKKLEEEDAELLVAKNNRSIVEYYFTLSPCLPLYVLKTFKEVEWICSLDADVYFFGDPGPIFDRFKNYSIIVCPHKFTTKLLDTGVEKYGIYNVSFQAFRKDDAGIRCLEKWRKECIEWCYDYYDTENERFADQKYLDKWKQIFGDRLMELTDHTSGLAAWNLNNYHITCNNGVVFSNDDRLIFYHFHGLKRFSSKWFANGFTEYYVKISSEISRCIYLPYIKELDNWAEKLNIEMEVNKRYESNKNPLYKRLSRTESLFRFVKPDQLDFIKMHWLRKVYLFFKKIQSNKWRTS
jgi:hypothetical protein